MSFRSYLTPIATPPHRRHPGPLDPDHQKGRHRAGVAAARAARVRRRTAADGAFEAALCVREIFRLQSAVQTAANALTMTMTMMTMMRMRMRMMRRCT